MSPNINNCIDEYILVLFAKAIGDTIYFLIYLLSVYLLIPFMRKGMKIWYSSSDQNKVSHSGMESCLTVTQ